MSAYTLNYTDSRFAEGKAEGMVEGRAEGRKEGEIIGSVKTLLAQIMRGSNDVPSAAEEMNLTVEEFRQLVHDLYPDTTLPK